MVSEGPESAGRNSEHMYELGGLVNVWPAGAVGGVPVAPSYRHDPVAVLARLQWDDGRALWVPAHASRWNRAFVLVTVTPVEGDRRSETTLWLHHTDVVRELDRKSTRLNSSHVKISYA